MKSANRLFRSHLFIPAFYLLSSTAFSLHAIEPDPRLASTIADIPADHMIFDNKAFVIPTPSTLSSSLSQVCIHWNDVDTEQSRVDAVIATNSPLPFEVLKQLRYFGLDAELVNRVQWNQQFTHFYKFTPFTSYGSAPLPILPEQLNLDSSLLGMPGISRVLSKDAMADCQPLRNGQSGIGLEVEDHHYHFSIKGILTCGHGSSKQTKEKPADDSKTEKNKASHKKDSLIGKLSPGSSGSDSGEDGDDEEEKKKKKSTSREPADEKELTPTLQVQLVAIHEHPNALEAAANQLNHSIGGLPPELISWSEGNNIVINTTSDNDQQWVSLLEGINSNTIAANLIGNFPPEFDDVFKEAIHSSWRVYIKSGLHLDE